MAQNLTNFQIRLNTAIDKKADAVVDKILREYWPVDILGKYRENKPVLQLRLAIEYVLAKKEGKPILAQNYNAAVNFQEEGYVEGMQEIIGSSKTNFSNSIQENSMSVKKVIAKKSPATLEKAKAEITTKATKKVIPAKAEKPVVVKVSKPAVEKKESCRAMTVRLLQERKHTDEEIVTLCQKVFGKDKKVWPASERSDLICGDNKIWDGQPIVRLVRDENGKLTEWVKAEKTIAKKAPIDPKKDPLNKFTNVAKKVAVTPATAVPAAAKKVVKKAK